MVRSAYPSFFTMTLSILLSSGKKLSKMISDLFTEITGTIFTAPIPIKPTDTIGFKGSLDCILIEASFLPFSLGEKITSIVHSLFDSILGQFISPKEKFRLSAPAITILGITKSPSPTFLIEKVLTFCSFTRTVPKSMLFGDISIFGKLISCWIFSDL